MSYQPYESYPEPVGYDYDYHNDMTGIKIRRRDTTRGPPLRILSLDGGGVRGYSMFIILQELMHRTFVEIEGRAPKRHEIPKPCDHFDLIIGTGTGGLIAIMLGRMRLDLESCKDLYVRMTRRVFETDKTIAGVPYRSTLFKASKLEEAIIECVREHCTDEDELGDSIAYNLRLSANPGENGRTNTIRRTPSVGSRYSMIGQQSVNRTSTFPRKMGNPNTKLYDNRENRTKMAVTAVYKGTPLTGNPVLLRSYDSRKEPAPETNCSIWQAGRATCATGLAFKPIQIGQSMFMDEGCMKYNPAPMVLDEAVCNEWPGREVGVFVSVGTGKRPKGTNGQQHLWWEGFVSSQIGNFAEARRRLIAKIEGCEETHQYMLKEHLAKRGVSRDNYYRLNVEVGVGEFGMNEWNRLAEISTNTRMYLGQQEVQRMNFDAAMKLSRIYRTKQRWDAAARGDAPINTGGPGNRTMWRQTIAAPLQSAMSYSAVELPAGDDMVSPMSGMAPAQPPRPPSSLISPTTIPGRRFSDEKMVVPFSDEFPEPISNPHYAQPRLSQEHPAFRPGYVHGGGGGDGGHLASEYQNLVAEPHTPPRVSVDGREDPPALPPKTPPPLPPKTPLADRTPMPRPPPPYPDIDAPPPIVNHSRKPEYLGR